MRDDDIAREAWRREASHHEGHRNFRPHLRPRGANLMGLRGEEAFAREFGLTVDLTPRLKGDGGRDLEIRLRTDIEGVSLFKVDCKAAIIPKDLIVEVGCCRPKTIYVLCRYWEEDDICTLLGWQWGHTLLCSTPKDYGYGIINLWCPRNSLRDLQDLHERHVNNTAT